MDVSIDQFRSGEHLIVFASDKDRTIAGSELHTDFQIDQDGEALFLTAPEGSVLDEVEFSEIPTDVSFGRKPDGAADWYFFENPSPGEKNKGDGYKEVLAAPKFSMEGGYNRPFSLELSNQKAGTTIRYTLDGSVPDSTSMVYQSPITIIDRTEEPNRLSTIRTTPEEGDEKGLAGSDPIEMYLKEQLCVPGYSKMETNRLKQLQAPILLMMKAATDMICR